MGPEIGQDHRIKKFCRGIAKKRPPKPKYDVTWDPKIVIDYFSKGNPNEELSLKELSQKLITLLALTTGHRFQTFSVINLQDIRKTDKYIEIKISARIKTSGPGRSQPTLIVPFYPPNKSICVASILELYMERTKKIRDSVSTLFISWKKPFNSVSTQTLSRWVKTVLDLSGINTNIFTPYSTRHASTSAAMRSGVNIDTIKRTAGWTESSLTFAKFYNLRLTEERDVFSRSILTL